MGEKRVKIEVTPEQIRAIATQRALGASLEKLEKEHGLSRPVINRALSTELGKGIQKEVIDTAIEGAVREVKRELAGMSTLALSALKDNLKDSNIDAVKVYFKALGMDVSEKKDLGQQQAITVVLPGQAAPKDVVSESN